MKRVLLAEDELVGEIHLKQPGFAYSACGLFTKTSLRIRNFK